MVDLHGGRGITVAMGDRPAGPALAVGDKERIWIAIVNGQQVPW